MEKYYAFISYRHADNKEQGRQWATWLHQAIETYEVPDDLVGKTNGRGEEIPARIYPIFRDEEELPADANLGSSITTALNSSRLLIVLCSPRAVSSTYVAEEIDHFKSQGGSERILAAIIDGEPNASWDKGKKVSGFFEEDECFPEPLQFKYDDRGIRTEKRAEPIASDFRINNNGRLEQGWTSTEAYRQHLQTTSQFNGKETQGKVSKYQKQQHLMLLKIIAGILGVPLGELTRRDKEYQLDLERKKARRLRQWLSAVAILAILAVGAGTLAYFQKKEALQQTEIAEEERAKAQKETKRANFQLEEANHNLGLTFLEKSKNADKLKLSNETNLYALYALEHLKTDDYINRSIAQRLNEFTPIYPVVFKTPKSTHHFRSVNSVSFSSDGRTLASASSDGTVILWDVLTGDIKTTFKGHLSEVTSVTFSPDGKTLASASLGDTVILWDVLTGDIKTTFKGHISGVNSVAFSPDGKTLASASADKTVILWDVLTGDIKTTLKVHTGIVMSVTFSPDGKTLALASNAATVFLCDLLTGDIKTTLKGHTGIVTSVTFSPDGKTLVSASGDMKWYRSSGHTEKHDINRKLFGGTTCQKEKAIQNNSKLTLLN